MAALTMLACLPVGPGQVAVFSRTFPVREVHRPQRPPIDQQTFVLLDNQPGELLWVTGFSLEGQEKGQPAPHFVGDSDLVGSKGESYFEAGQGLYRLDFPPGFGLPVPSDRRLTWRFGLLNLDAYQAATEVRFRGSVSFVRARNLEPDPHPLLTRTLALSSWKVPPGGSTQVDEVSTWLGLKVRQRLHLATVRLYPGADYSELRDATTGASLIRLKVRQRRQDGSLAAVDSYASSEGHILTPDHRYEIVTRYSNPTQREVPGGARWTFYFYDPDFSPPG